jgi:hypothetical protein
MKRLQKTAEEKKKYELKRNVTYGNVSDIAWVDPEEDIKKMKDAGFVKENGDIEIPKGTTCYGGYSHGAYHFTFENGLDLDFVFDEDLNYYLKEIK